ncbi:acetylcholine receptor subunit gamma-like [Ruditapes philippinarum]|uniref:acetylcholine receptor subunit gamma-like n=1 Tax=Ruditapes philippinarum TaxID=129788 RepID=UPI00295AB6A3|nr:acetylcholine receptor subunit gamma-like [Ruditapes philippinarum]
MTGLNFLQHIVVAFVLTSFILCRAANITNQNQLYDDLQQGYNKDIRPEETNVIQVVNFSLSLVSINRFDELNGELDMTSMITMSWVDSRLVWDSSKYGGLTSMMFPPSKIWTPQVYILNAYDLFEVENEQYVRVTSDGVVTWKPAQLLYLLCSVKKKGEVAPLENVTPVKEMKLSDTDQDDEDDSDAQEVTWKDVGLAFE